MPNKKMGRPKSDNPMNERITIRMDKETSNILNSYCYKNNLDKADGVRVGIHRLKDGK